MQSNYFTVISLRVVFFSKHIVGIVVVSFICVIFFEDIELEREKSECRMI